MTAGFLGRMDIFDGALHYSDTAVIADQLGGEGKTYNMRLLGGSFGRFACFACEMS